VTRDVRPEHADALSYFVPEAVGHLDAMSRALLALEQGRDVEDNIGSLFRAVHTLKGAAYVVGQTRVGDLAHRIEDVLVAARNDRLAPAAVDAIHAGVEAVRRLLRFSDASPDDASADALARLSAVAPAPAARHEDADAPAGSSAGAAASASPAAPRRVPASPGDRTGSPSRGPIAGMRLDLVLNLAGELVVARRRLEGRLRELDRMGEVLELSRARMVRAVGEFEQLHANRPAGTGDSSTEGACAGKTRASVDQLFSELELDRFDHVDILGRSLAEITADLAVIQAQLAVLGRSLSEDTTRIRRLTGSLRSEITRARLVPVGRVFARVAGQVRELAKAAGKDIGLETGGESVEVDAVIVEQMAGPVLHLLQNAIAHGIEPEAERRARGKSSRGRLSLHAHHRGGFIHIEVSDDGRGIDADLLKNEAVRQGLVPAAAARLMDEAEALDLIFLPGLSTASAVTSAAGRGMGLDVVRTAVGRLSGEVTVTTEAGAGTRFTIRLPLTVLISEALLARVGSEILAIPVNAVKRIATVPADQVQRAAHGERVWVEDQPLDLLRLARLLGLGAGGETARLNVVALRAAGRPVAVTVDEFLGKEEVVVRGLGDFLEGIGPFGGATFSEDGRIILVLDPVRLLETLEPVHADVAAPAPREELPAAPPAPPELPATRRILLVDDSISVRKFVGQMLEKAGFEVLTAGDGLEALKVLEETPVHAVITDLEMPRLNGFELIQELRQGAATRDLPIVVLTTRVGAKHLNLARWLGATDYVAKPVDEPAFVRLIDSLAAPAAPLTT